MAAIKLFVDSVANMEDGLAARLGIATIPYNIVIDGVNRKDGVDVTARDVYAASLDKTRALPKTSGIAAGDLIAPFGKVLAAGGQVVYMTISSYLSASYGNALAAVRELQGTGRILVVDTHTISMGMGLMAERCQADIEAGLDLKAIAADMEDLKKRLAVEFCIEKLDNLYRGGRCSGLSYFFGKKLHIHPIVGMVEGKLIPLSKTRGKDIRLGLERLLADLREDLATDNLDRSFPVYVVDADAPLWSKALETKARDLLQGLAAVRFCEASSVVAVHAGPGTVGLGWVRKKAPART